MKINYIIMCLFCSVVSFFNIQNNNNEILFPCIMYHSIYETRNNDYVLSPIKFEEDLKYIKENNFTTVFISEIIEFNEGKKRLPKKPIAITFDDGYYNNYTKVLPLLKKYKMKATINLVGEFCDRDNDKKQHNYYSCLNWKEVKEMSLSPYIEFQNHSNKYHHVNKGNNGIKKRYNESVNEYSKRLLKDVLECENKIFKATNKKTNAFAYPFGAYSKESHNILYKAGYKALLTCNEHLTKIKPGQDYILLGRYNRASHYSTQTFFDRVLNNK